MTFSFQRTPTTSRLVFIVLLTAWLALSEAGAFPFADSVYVAPKYSRFEQYFKSTVAYPNPREDAILMVVFTSPLGDAYKVRGFWDGGKIWRVRFSPNVVGEWKYQTTCSDALNDGLDKLEGKFLCSSPVGASAFQRHGPLIVTRDRRHLAFADHSPFFWLSDNTGNGSLQAKPAEWQFYALIRAHEDFTVAMWDANPGNFVSTPAISEETARMFIDRKALKQMDIREQIVERAGLVNAIIPLKIGPNHEALTDDAAIALVRDMVARWGADDVVWVLPCEAGTVAAWKKIGRAVFGDISHAPVILQATESYWVLDEFRDERWVDAFGYGSGQDISDDALQWLLLGPVTKDWKREPMRPLINLAPLCENQWVIGPAPRAIPQAVRRTAWWSALTTPIAGVSYSAQGVWNWDTNVDAALATAGFESWANWRKDLFLPAAKQMGVLADFFESVDFASLNPAPELLAHQPGMESPARFIAAARSTSGNFAVIYTPEGATIELAPKMLPPQPVAWWLNPRDGSRAPATMNSSEATRTFATPDSGDWLLVLKSAKN